MAAVVWVVLEQDMFHKLIFNGNLNGNLATAAADIIQFLDQLITATPTEMATAQVTVNNPTLARNLHRAATVSKTLHSLAL